MKVAIIADVHGNMQALEKVLEDARLQGVSQYIVLGDIVMVGPEPLAVFQTIKSLNPVIWIKGNTDIWFEQMNQKTVLETAKELELFQYYLFAKDRISKRDIDFIKDLPMQEIHNFEGHEILCVHGSPRSVNEIMDCRIPTEELEQMVEGVAQSVILCGHSHVPYIGKICGKQIINVGSIGRPYDGNTCASYGLMDCDLNGNMQFSIRRVDYPVNVTIELARRNNFPNMKKYEKVLVDASLS